MGVGLHVSGDDDGEVLAQGGRGSVMYVLDSFR